MIYLSQLARHSDCLVLQARVVVAQERLQPTAPRVVNFKRDSENIFIIFQSSIGIIKLWVTGLNKGLSHFLEVFLDPSKFYAIFFTTSYRRSIPVNSMGNVIVSIVPSSYREI